MIRNWNEIGLLGPGQDRAYNDLLITGSRSSFLLKICVLFGYGFLEKNNLRISLLLVAVGLAGLYVEIINAFDYIQGSRHGLSF